MSKIEVIIPVCRPDKRFYEMLKRLFRQSIKPYRVSLVLTLTDTYGELELINGLARAGIRNDRIRVNTIEKNMFDHGGTRQEAAQRSDAEYCIFMTQDAMPVDSRLIENLYSAFSKGNIAVSYARQIPYKSACLKEKFARGYNYPEKTVVKGIKELNSGSIKSIFCSDVCAMYDMETFRKLGGFVRKTDFNEDMLYAHKAIKNGYSICYAAEARVYHSHNLSLSDQFNRNRAIAVSQKQHPEVFGTLSSESEGLSYVRSGLKYILKNGKVADAAGFILDCGFRFLGYKAGKLKK